MGKPNYGFEKRRKEIEKKRKQEAKRQRKLEKRNAAVAETSESETDQGQMGEGDEVD